MFRYFVGKLFPDAIPVFHPSSVGKSKLTTLMLGWGGSKRKNLTKVIKYYNENNINVISHTMPLFIPLVLRGYFENKIVEEFKAHQTENFIFHVFSNTGTWAYAAISYRNLLPLPKLVIFDAAPHFEFEKPSIIVDSQMIGNMFTSVVLKRPVYYHPIITPIIQFFRIVGRVSTDFIELITNSKNYVIEYNLFLRDKSPVVPHIFIYSSGDTLIHSKSVKNYISILKSRNIPILEDKEFGDDVKHTGSFYTYPNEYQAILEKHITIFK